MAEAKPLRLKLKADGNRHERRRKQALARKALREMVKQHNRGE